MLNRLVFVALLAGCLAGLVTSVMQQTLVVPLIMAAETYEIAPHHHDASGAEVAETAPPTADPGPPTVDIRRAAITTVTTIGAAVGFALMLLAVMQTLGERVTTGSALGWGLAGFAVTGLAPALGLAPDLPGAAMGDLNLRQFWWLGTALATAVALWLVLRQKSSWAVGLAALLFAIPHIVGAPHPVILTSTVPAELAAAFAGRSLAIQAVFWALTGWFAGYFWARGEQTGAS